MKLYEVKVWEEKAPVHRAFNFETRFVSSRKEAGLLIRKKSKYRINQVTLRDRLDRSDLILLLEGDAPGTQDQVLTPVDLIMDRQLVKEKGFD